MEQPLVSIIIPTFNRATIINDTLDSIINQTYPNWECIVVDDGSCDSTFSVIGNYCESDSRIKRFKRPDTKLKGANACRNFGLSHAKGYYCIFFDSDDIMATNCLEQRVKLFSEHPEKDFLVFSMGVFSDKSLCEIYPYRKVINLSLKETLEDFILSSTLPWNVSRPIFKTELIQNQIEFNEEIQNFQDEEFNVRVLGFLKPKYLSIDITDCYYRFDEASINKYNSTKGYQDIIDSLYYYYTSVFLILSKKQKTEYKKKLIQRLFRQLKHYVNPKINPKYAFMTIRLFKSELSINLVIYCLLFLIIYLNTYYHNRKGYYRITKFMYDCI